LQAHRETQPFPVTNSSPQRKLPNWKPPKTSSQTAYFRAVPMNNIEVQLKGVFQSARASDRVRT
jgi:hypothetical protein